MPCTQRRQLVCFPKVRVSKSWFRRFNNSTVFHNEGTLHLFSLMALYSYANFRSDTRTVSGVRYTAAPGEWICRRSSLPRILRVRSERRALELLGFFSSAGFLDYRMLDEERGILKYRITNWRKHCTHLDYNYYSYKSTGFFFFPLSAGRQLLRSSRRRGKIIFSELDAIADIWLHTVAGDDRVAGSGCVPVLYYTDMHGLPLLSYSYLAERWGWSKSRVGRFIQKAEENGIIDRLSFPGSRGSVISVRKYREMLFGPEDDRSRLRRLGELLGLPGKSGIVSAEAPAQAQSRVPSGPSPGKSENRLRDQGFRFVFSSFFAVPFSLVFHSITDCGNSMEEVLQDKRGPP